MAQEALGKAPLPSTPEKFQLKKEGALLKREQMPATPEQIALPEAEANQRMLKDYLRSISEQGKASVSMAETPVKTLEADIEKFNIPTTKEIGAKAKWAEQLVRKEPLEGATSKIPDLATTMDDKGLARRLRDARVKEAIFGAEPAPLGVGQMSMGAIPMARSLLKSAGSWATTLPIDTRRWLNKVVGNEKWSTLLQQAYERGG